jgi:hypothetical protein
MNKHTEVAGASQEIGAGLVAGFRKVGFRAVATPRSIPSSLLVALTLASILLTAGCPASSSSGRSGAGSAAPQGSGTPSQPAASSSAAPSSGGW